MKWIIVAKNVYERRRKKLDQVKRRFGILMVLWSARRKGTINWWVLRFAELDKEAWYQLKYVECFDEFKNFVDNTERIQVKDVSPELFIERYEKPYKPVVIQGSTDSWKAVEKWTIPVSWNWYGVKFPPAQIVHGFLFGFCRSCIRSTVTRSSNAERIMKAIALR